MQQKIPPGRGAESAPTENRPMHSQGTAAEQNKWLYLRKGEDTLYIIRVRMRKLGKKNREAVEPVEFTLKEKPGTVRELITGLVKLGVKEYNERKDTGQILPYLTKEEISQKASAGKVSFGVRGGEDADEDQAAENALQCFEDGIFRVFADDEELERLEQEIPWREETVFTFVRLAMLSGW